MDEAIQHSVRPEAKIAAAFDRLDPLRIRYEANELICQAGTYAAGIHVVTSGIVLETYAGETHADPSVATDLLIPGDMIGIGPLLADRGALHPTSCRACSSVSLSFLERSAFDAALESDVPLRRLLTAHLAARTQRLTRALWRAQLPADERLARLLLELARLEEPLHGTVHLAGEIDLRLIARLAGLSARRARQIGASLPGVQWTDEGLCLAIGELADSLGTARASLR